MSQKCYIHQRTDLADAAAVETYAVANPTQFVLGSFIVAADGTVCIVTDGAVGTTQLITVGEPTP
jgi:hypothetical protein